MSAAMPTESDYTCMRCNAPLHAMGVERFRVGGTSGGWKMLFGEWAELGEEMNGFEVLACKGCRKIELRLPADG